LSSKTDAYKAEIGHVKEAINKVEGWLADAEGEFLYNAAKNCKGNGVIVEIGSWKGKSTIWLAKGAKAGGNVEIYAIDPHTGSLSHKRHGEAETLKEFKENLKRANVEDIVVPVVKTSEDAERDWDGKPIELLWIDGAHEYEMVKLDFDLWFQYLIEGGTIALHDTTYWPGPKRVAKDKIYKSHHFTNVRFIGSLTYAQKVGANSLVDRLKNRWVLFVKGIYQLGQGLRLPKPIRKWAKKIVSLVQ
jgi:predicted O-methyltransferase YrrM